jgi:hypothetical protein
MTLFLELTNNNKCKYSKLEQENQVLLIDKLKLDIVNINDNIIKLNDEQQKLNKLLIDNNQNINILVKDKSELNNQLIINESKYNHIISEMNIYNTKNKLFDNKLLERNKSMDIFKNSPIYKLMDEYILINPTLNFIIDPGDNICKLYYYLDDKKNNYLINSVYININDLTECTRDVSKKQIYTYLRDWYQFIDNKIKSFGLSDQPLIYSGGGRKRAPMSRPNPNFVHPYPSLSSDHCGDPFKKNQYYTSKYNYFAQSIKLIEENKLKQSKIDEENKLKQSKINEEIRLKREEEINNKINKMIELSNNYINKDEAISIITMFAYELIDSPSNTNFPIISKCRFESWKRYFRSDNGNTLLALQVMNKFASEHKIRVEDAISIFREYMKK